MAAVLPGQSLTPPASRHAPPHRPSECDAVRQETLLPGGWQGGNPGLSEAPQDAPGPTATGAHVCSGGLGGQKKGGTFPRQRQLPEAPSRWHLGRAFRTAALGTGVSRTPHDPRHPTTPGTPRLHSTNTGLLVVGVGVLGGLPALCSVSGAQPRLTWGRVWGRGQWWAPGMLERASRGLSGSER